MTVDGFNLLEIGCSYRRLFRIVDLRKPFLCHAVTLEILGDLPTADAAPPENVLFVAKLNPATRDEDLKIIFARYISTRRVGYFSVVRCVRSAAEFIVPFLSLLQIWRCGIV